MKSIRLIIECLDLPINILGEFLIREIDELIKAKDIDESLLELDDILFSLATLVYHKTGIHQNFVSDEQVSKIKYRLKKYGTISKNEINDTSQSIENLNPDIIHFAFSFPLLNTINNSMIYKNGSENEIDKIIKAFPQKKQFIINFQKINRIKVNKLFKNVYLCSIPIFIFKNWHPKYSDVKIELIFLQVSAILSRLNISTETIFHFHSWESGILLSNTTFKSMFSINISNAIYSPYLPVTCYNRKNKLFNNSFETINKNKISQALKYEDLLIDCCKQVVVESKKDYKILRRKCNNIKIFNFSNLSKLNYCPILNKNTIKFITGGRAVPEKGFHFLIKNFRNITEWAEKENIKVSLDIFCLETSYSSDIEKGSDYILKLREITEKLNLSNIIRINKKIAIDELEKIINTNESFVIIPSLYDPFNLMGVYALKLNRPFLISIHAGVCENLKSPNHCFDPEKQNQLFEKFINIYDTNPSIYYENNNEEYYQIYS
jgi:glycosyltransferase involved in cell wall biosynthesis